MDGVLVDMGAENPLNPQIAMALVFAFADLGYPRQLLVIGHQRQVSSEKATARQPDLVVHSFKSDAAMAEKKILPVEAASPRLVVEVVSNSKSDLASRKRDDEEKVVEYAARGIGEYWIIDPDKAVVSVSLLTDDEYRFCPFTEKQAVTSMVFPNFDWTVQQVLTAGR